MNSLHYYVLSIILPLVLFLTAVFGGELFVIVTGVFFLMVSLFITFLTDNPKISSVFSFISVLMCAFLVYYYVAGSFSFLSRWS